MPDFCHLHCHTSYSLLDGAARIKTLLERAAAMDMKALGITDHGNLFGIPEFYTTAKKIGVHPVLGSEFYVTASGMQDRQVRTRYHQVLWAKNEQGYRNLTQLSSLSYTEGFYYKPRIDHEALRRYGEGLVATTCCLQGEVPQTILKKGEEAARAVFEAYLDLFGDDYYIEIQNHGIADQQTVNAVLVRWAREYGVKIVATNDVHYVEQEDAAAQDVLLCLQTGKDLLDPSRMRFEGDQFYLKSTEEMQAAIAEVDPEIVQQALAATGEIADKCRFDLAMGNLLMPHYPIPEAFGDDIDAYLRHLVFERARSRYPEMPQTVVDRLTHELGIIKTMGYTGYFLIVQDFTTAARELGVSVGPGRGSAAGSAVAYCLGITNIDPLKYGLLFERFLNPERVSMPDFDIDFCVEGRERVIRYVQERYGEEQVGQIITFGTLLARGVLRDVGRVLEMPYGQVDKLTKLVPQNPANPVTLAQAIEGEPKLQSAIEEEPVVARLMSIAKKLEGLHRHASTHAAGVVIGDRPLEELVPLYRDPKTGMRVTQFNMKWVEQAGLVKFDFLGLKTLTVLRAATDLLKLRGIEVDLPSLPIDDAYTYERLRKGETVGVFQVESAGMRKALVEMSADRFEDIIALVALYRPGPMANIPVYCERKLGRDAGNEKNWYPHEKLEPILAETFGIIVYQEQVMEVAKVLAGYSLGDADLLRRAMGKKIKAEMDAQRDRFVKGAVERGLDKAKANEIFDLLAKFADYGFNKSHAAAYALITYQTAYLKANFPVEFMAASMSLDIDNTDKLAELRQDAQRLGIKVEPPNVNRSGVVFEVHDGAIRYALAAIKGVGRAAVEAIVQARGDTPFRDLGDFARRLNPKQVNKRTLENLVAAGALDAIEPDRAKAFAAVEPMMRLAQGAAEAETVGMMDMFGGVIAAEVALRIPAYENWPMADRLKREYDAVGFFLSGHPLDEYGDLLQKLRVQTWAEFCRSVRAGTSTVGRVAASVLDRAERRTKTGNKLGIVTLSDQTGHFEAIIFSEGLSHYRDMLEPGAALVLQLQASTEGEDVRARIQTCEPLDQAAARHQKGMRIYLRDERPISSVQQRLQVKGEGEVSLILILDGGEREVEVKLGGKYQATPQIAGALRAVPGVVQVEVS